MSNLGTVSNEGMDDTAESMVEASYAYWLMSFKDFILLYGANKVLTDLEGIVDKM